MHTRLLIALLTGCFVAGESVAAELPLAPPPPQLSYPGPLLPVEWTGIYFGVNAGYGWAKGSSATIFTGALTGNTTTPLGLGPTELAGTNVFGSSNPSGGIAGGQMGFNWQWGRVVVGAEADGQWSGQQATASLLCTPSCTATSTVNIKSLATGRARFGLAFDWLLPYATAGAALVNVDDNLTVSTPGGTGAFKALSSSSLGWAAGAGLDMALSSNWSARIEYLHIEANGFKPTIPIPGILGAGTASESATYRDDVLRFALNYRFGPRGGPGVLETPIAPRAFALNYDFLPSVAYIAEKVTPARTQLATTQQPAPHQATTQQATSQQATSQQATSQQATSQQVTPAPIRTADAAPETAVIPIQPNPAIPSQPNPAKSEFKNFSEIGALEDGETIALPKLAAKKPREKEEDESKRLKRVMSICSGC